MDMPCNDPEGCKHFKAEQKLQAENEQQADFLSLAKEEMDSLQAENEKLQDALVYAHCQLVNINATRKALKKTVVNLEIINQALGLKEK